MLELESLKGLFKKKKKTLPTRGIVLIITVTPVQTHFFDVGKESLPSDPDHKQLSFLLYLACSNNAGWSNWPITRQWAVPRVSRFGKCSGSKQQNGMFVNPALLKLVSFLTKQNIFAVGKIII